MASSTYLRFRSILNDFDPKAVRVELYADGVGGAAPLRQEMKRVRQLDGVSGVYVYSALCLQPACKWTIRRG